MILSMIGIFATFLQNIAYIILLGLSYQIEKKLGICRFFLSWLIQVQRFTVSFSRQMVFRYKANNFQSRNQKSFLNKFCHVLTSIGRKAEAAMKSLVTHFRLFIPLEDLLEIGFSVNLLTNFIKLDSFQQHNLDTKVAYLFNRNCTLSISSNILIRLISLP
jgi:hypothetical protein